MNGIIDIQEVREHLRHSLKQSRLEIGLRILDVAEYLGMTPSAYSYYESGRSVPTIDSLIKLAALYNKGFDELLGSQEILLKNMQYNRYNAEMLYVMEKASDYQTSYQKKLENLTNDALRHWLEEELEQLSATQVQQLRLMWEILKLKEPSGVPSPHNSADYVGSD